MSIRILHTKSGARYEVDEAAGLIRRGRSNIMGEPHENGKRRDGEWLRLLAPIPEWSMVGMRLFLTLEPLGAFGPDDEGRVGSTEPTRRVTTVVVFDSIGGEESL